MNRYERYARGSCTFRARVWYSNPTYPTYQLLDYFGSVVALVDGSYFKAAQVREMFRALVEQGALAPGEGRPQLDLSALADAETLDSEGKLERELKPAPARPF